MKQITQVIIDCESPEEGKILRDFVVMYRTAKAHGWAEVKIIIKDHIVKQGDLLLETRW